MNENRDSSLDCTRFLALLEEAWVGANRVELSPEASGHIDSCPECRGAAQSVQNIDSSLRQGFAELGDWVGPPSPARMEETLRLICPPAIDADVIRRMRRPLRLLFWSLFFAFTLLGCFALAVAVLKVAAGH
jgi:hypothetical protein